MRVISVNGAMRLLPYHDAARIAHYVATLVPAWRDLHVERVAEGVSTIVYRVCAADHIAYLRICPDAGVSLAAEVAAHRQLIAMGLRVPQVLHFEPHNPIFQRSLMLVRAVPGRAIGSQPPPRVDLVLRQAGREIARLNQISVQGYGWANRIVPTTGGLAAEYATLAAWLQAHFAKPIQALTLCDGLSGQAVEQVVLLLERAGDLFAHEAAVLAHGDFDVTHIYFQHDDYTGMIDLGEIRGAPWFYDLSHFAIENGPLLPELLAGYRDVRSYTPTDLANLKLMSVLIAARRIGRRMLQQRLPHPDVAYVVRMLAALDSDMQR